MREKAGRDEKRPEAMASLIEPMAKQGTEG
jgi:hypothetical protein